MTTFPSPLHAGSVPPISLCNPHCWHSHGVLIVFTDPSSPCADLLLRPTFLNKRQKHLVSLKFRCLGWSDVLHPNDGSDWRDCRHHTQRAGRWTWRPSTTASSSARYDRRRRQRPLNHEPISEPGKQPPPLATLSFFWVAKKKHCGDEIHFKFRLFNLLTLAKKKNCGDTLPHLQIYWVAKKKHCWDDIPLTRSSASDDILRSPSNGFVKSAASEFTKIGRPNIVFKDTGCLSHMFRQTRIFLGQIDSYTCSSKASQTKLPPIVTSSTNRTY